MKLSEMGDINKNANEKSENAFENGVKEKYDTLKDLPSGTLQKMLEEEVKKQKASGQFNYEALISAIEKAKNFMPSETYNSMKNTLNGLK